MEAIATAEVFGMARDRYHCARVEEEDIHCGKPLRAETTKHCDVGAVDLSHV
jgi:hypothetical protein